MSLKENNPHPAAERNLAPTSKTGRTRAFVWKALPYVLFGLVCVAYWGTTLWGIDAQFTWGHYGYNAGYHGANARNFLRHDVWTPAHYVGHAPPPKARYKLHHPISMYLYLAGAIWLFGEHEWVIRIVPAVFTFLTLLALFWITRRLWNPWAATVASAVFVALPQNLIFSGMMNYDPTAIFYTIVAAGSFIIWFEEDSWKAGIVALIALALAGTVDWPPYVVAFVVGLYGLGNVSSATRIGKKLDGAFPRGLVGTAVVILMVFLTNYGLRTHTNFSIRLQLIFALLVVLAMSVGQCDNHRHGKTWFDRRWLRLCAWGLVAVAALCFHFYYTWKVGAWQDVMASYDLRTSGKLGESFLKHYREKILEVMYTDPMLLVGLFWFALLPIRAVFDRLPARTILPLSFAAAQLFLNYKFPNEIQMHGYRAYHYVIFFPLAFADLMVLGADVLKALARRNRWWWKIGVPVGGATALFMFSWLVREAKPRYIRSRHVSGTMNLKNYRPHRHKLRFFKTVRLLTSPQTFVLYRRFLHPRYEGLWYLDRDSGPVRRLPRSYRGAQQTARRIFWRLRRPKHDSRSPEARWFDRGVRKPRRRKPLPPFDRPVAGLGDLRHKSVRRTFKHLAKRYAVRVFGHFVCVFYDKPGPDLKAWRFTARRRTPWQQYLRWRKWELLLRPDPKLARIWRHRFGLDTKTKHPRQ